MGDRCYLRLTIHGHIEKAAHFEAIVKAILAEGLTDDEYGGGNSTEEGVRENFALSLADNTSPRFSDSECNYANIDGLEAVLQEHGVAWGVDHDAGGDYPAGCRSWTKEHGEMGASQADGEAVIAASEIAKALSADDPLAAVHRLVEDAERAAGKGMPTFSVGEEVRQLLAVRIAKQALGLKEKAA